MELPLGITGFRSRHQTLPSCDLEAFRSYCYTVAILLQGRLIVSEPPSPVANYIATNFELPDGGISVLLNHHYPILAFAEPSLDRSWTLKFVNNAGLAEIFSSFGLYQLLSADQAQASPRDENYQYLAKVEIKQIGYWKPPTIGDIIFNNWD